VPEGHDAARGDPRADRDRGGRPWLGRGGRSAGPRGRGCACGNRALRWIQDAQGLCGCSP